MNEDASNSEFFKKLDHLLNIQIDDLRTALASMNAPFLVACGCMNTIEFLGGILDGKLGEKNQAKTRFFDGIDLLGQELGIRRFDFRSITKNTLWQLRNALTHEYVPKVDEIGWIMIHVGIDDNGVTGSSFSNKHGLLTVDLNELVKAIESARLNLLSKLKTDITKMERAKYVINLFPEIVSISRRF
jgi:hypothetical protein